MYPYEKERVSHEKDLNGRHDISRVSKNKRLFHFVRNYEYLLGL